MAATPVYGITYPLPTDRVADGATAMRSTAETVEAALLAAVANVNSAGRFRRAFLFGMES